MTKSHGPGDAPGSPVQAPYDPGAAPVEGAQSTVPPDPRVTASVQLQAGVGAAAAPAPDVPAADPFAEFEEDPLDDEVTRINQDNIIAEERTTILKEAEAKSYLVVDAGRDVGKRFSLTMGNTAIGRSVDNDVILTDASISRRHVRIESRGSQFYLVDLGSGNGTSLNGSKIRDAPLFHEDRIELGETVMRVEAPSHVRNAPAVLPGSAMPGSLPPSGFSSHPPGVQGFASGRPDAPVAGFSQPPPHAASNPVFSPAPPEVVVRKTARYGWWPYAVAAGVSLLIGVGIVGAILWSRPPAETAAEVPVEDLFNRAMHAMERQRFEQARDLFTKIVAYRPDHSASRAELRRATEALEDQATLRAAEAALRRREWARALVKAEEVESGSVFASRALEIQQTAKLRILEVALDGAERALASGDLEKARGRAEFAASVDPADARLQRLMEELEEAENGGGRRRPPRAGGTVRRPRTTGNRPPRTQTRPTAPTSPTPTTPNASEAAVQQLLAEARRRGTRTAAGCQHVRRARRGGSGGAEANAMWQECVQNAQQRFDSAQNQPTAVQRHMLHQVIGMVGSDHPLFARAQEQLRSLPQDEDE